MLAINKNEALPLDPVQILYLEKFYFESKTQYALSQLNYMNLLLASSPESMDVSLSFFDFWNADNHPWKEVTYFHFRWMC